MVRALPITHAEEQAARSAGERLRQVGQSLLQQGIAPAMAETVILSALAGMSVQEDRDGHGAGGVDWVKAKVRDLGADPALAVVHFLAEFGSAWGLSSGLVRLPSELLWLMDALAGLDGGSAWCPFGLSLQSAILAARRYETVLFEDTAPLPFQAALSELLPHLRFRQADPLVDEPPALQGPLTVLSAPALARRISPVRTLRSLGPAGESTSNGELVRLDLLVSRQPQRLVTLASWGLLAGSRRLESMFKAALLSYNLLDAVIQLPANLIPGTRWNPALLVIDDSRDPDEPVRLLDSSEGFHEVQKSRGSQARLTGWQEAALSVLEVKGNRLEILDGQALIAADCDITPRRHVQAAPASGEAPASAQPLRQLVRMLRGQSWPGAKVLKEGEKPDGAIFHEAAIRDIGPDGILRRPEKRLLVSGPISTAQRNQLLQAGDILLSCKGSVGKVALVPEDCGENWIPSQSFQVLRPLPGTDSICLFHQLRSAALQSRISQLVAGGTVPQIKAADVNDLPVPVLSAEESAAIHAAHEALLAIGREIGVLEGKRRDVLVGLGE